MNPLAQVVQTVRQYFRPPQLRNYEALDPLETAVPEVTEVPARRTAVEILKSDPGLSARELARQAGVTIAYANMLVRRRRPRPAIVAPPPVLASPIELQPEHRTATQILDAAGLGLTIDQIADMFKISQGEVDFALKIARIAKKH
jgi:hypothetical protein